VNQPPFTRFRRRVRVEESAREVSSQAKETSKKKAAA
jgi:hypothetical protein